MSSDPQYDDEISPLPLSTVPTKCYDVIRHPRRLRVIAALDAFDGAVSVSTLTSEIQSRADHHSTEEPSTTEIRLSLVHTHLPKLADYDIVDWDGEHVSKGENAVPSASAVSLLEACSEHDDAVLETLVHPVRMSILRLLETSDQGYSLEDLATLVAELTVGASDSHRTVQIELHHSHLPAMADIGVLEYSDGWVETSAHSKPSLH